MFLGEDLSEEMILIYLSHQYTGNATSDISCCNPLHPAQDYKEARKILYQRFGRSHVTAQRVFKLVRRKYMSDQE